MTEIKVQFGAGGNPLKGFENWDSDVDISQPLPYADESVSFVFIEHCLEHVTARQGFGFMQEAFRILRPGGTLRICVPTLSRIKDRAHALDLVVGHGHQMVFSHGSLIDMLFAAGFHKDQIKATSRAEIDGHWKVIGIEKDDLETLRIEARK